MSKISVRRQSLWSVKSAMERKLSFSSLSCFFLLSPYRPFHELQALLRGGFGWVGLRRRLCKWTQSLEGPSHVRLVSLRDSPAPEGGNAFPTRALCFCSKVSLWLLSLTHSLISRRFTGATDTARFQCAVQPRWWEPGQAAPLGV